MNTLQVTMICIWVVIILGGVFIVGQAWGAGWQLVGGFLVMIAYYGGLAALGFFTLKALIGF